MRSGKAGTGFFDRDKRFRGSALFVSKRARALSDMTVIDVVGADPGLTEFLAGLSKSPLVLQEASSGDTLFSFRSASGYVNGSDIRIQGSLLSRA
jgi:hypothetical protein